MDLTAEHLQQLYANLWPHCLRSAGQSRIYRYSQNPFTVETAHVRAPVTYFDWASHTGCSDFSVILIREEYKKLRGLLEQLGQAFRCLLLGQPGTGIKHCLFYILVHRLHRGLPTAFQIHEDEYHLFDNTGAHRVAGDDLVYATMPRDRWGLTVCSPSLQLAYRSVTILPYVVIQTGLPRDFRTNDRFRLEKILPNHKQYIMALPSWDEMEAIGVLHGWDLQRLRPIFDDWGPSIRVCKSLVTAPVDRVQAYHASMERNVSEAVATGNLKRVALAAVQGVDLPGVDSETPSSIFFYYDENPLFLPTFYGLSFRRVTVPGRITRQLLASAGGECPPDGVSRFYLTPYGH